ncbi:hypothetical protein [Heliomicrobium modesticaldum]|uniref:hypothetical protein n=1 Tax=Heliomicrobium modesticaldum TaxID=35701 RepID=UPI001A9A54DB|nr:hypothetical protein [Heliomicrobium modesticaldum]
MVVDSINKKVFIATYSMKEARYNVMHQDGPAGQDNFVMPLHTVFQTDYDFTNTVKLFDEHLWVRTLMTDGNNLVALCDRKYNDSTTPSMVFCYNFTSKKVSKKPWESARLQVGDANYSADGKKIYAISTIDEKRGLYEYDTDTLKQTPLFVPEKGFINNIQIIK